MARTIRRARQVFSWNTTVCLVSGCPPIAALRVRELLQPVFRALLGLEIRSETEATEEAWNRLGSIPNSSTSEERAEININDEQAEISSEEMVAKTMEFALRSLVENVDKAGQEDLSVIGPIKEDGEPLYATMGPWPNKPAEEILDSEINVIRHCTMRFPGAPGFVYPKHLPGFDNTQTPSFPNTSDQSRDNPASYLVSRGLNIMVQTSSLPILHRASAGRLTPQKLWMLARKKGYLSEENHSRIRRTSYGMPEMDYGNGVKDPFEMAVFPFPNMGDAVPEGNPWEKIRDLVDKGANIEKTKENLIWQGGYWTYMWPERFPLNGPIIPPPSFTQRPSTNISDSPSPTSSSNQPTALGSLPLELLLLISAHIPLQSLLTFASTSKTIRHRLLGDEGNRNWLGKEEIKRRKPWLWPHAPVAEVPRTPPAVSFDDPFAPDGAWSYFERCMSSPSMRNRQRIWKAVERLDAMAEEEDL